MSANPILDAEVASTATRGTADLVAEVASDYVADLVRAWFVKHLHNSVVSRDVDALNHISASLPHLVLGIKELLKK